LQEVLVLLKSPESLPEIDRLALLYRISQTFNSSLDLDQILNLVMDEVIAAMHAERGFLMLADGDGNLVFRTARGLDQKNLEEPEMQISQGVLDRVWQEGKPLLTSNAQVESGLSGRESVVFLGLRSVLCVPLQFKGRKTGVIYVDNRVQAGIFFQNDLDLMTAIADNAAVAIENARLYLLAVEKGRIERELQLARETQTSLLPQSLPDMEGWQFYAEWQPAREVAGDFYDFIDLNENELGVIIADVSDKGMSSALYMALTRSILRALLPGAASPADGMLRANRQISADASDGMFVTLFYANIDVQKSEITYVNAGHNPPLYFNSDMNSLQRLTRTGMAMGVDGETPYSQEVIQFNPGDFILFYTDGISEATNAQMQEFGEMRIQNILFENHMHSANQIGSALKKAVRKFCGYNVPADDCTVIVIKRTIESDKSHARKTK
jgi:phosphoserine phosphatase RsbU/P